MTASGRGWPVPNGFQADVWGVVAGSLRVDPVADEAIDDLRLLGVSFRDGRTDTP